MSRVGRAPFGRDRRLLAKRDFDRVFTAGRRAFARGLVVYVDRSPSGWPRLGLVTGRRFGNAVARNRARRLLREAFRIASPDLAPLDIVALPQAGSFPDHPAAVQTALREAVSRAARAPARPPLPTAGPGAAP